MSCSCALGRANTHLVACQAGGRLSLGHGFGKQPETLGAGDAAVAGLLHVLDGVGVHQQQGLGLRLVVLLALWLRLGGSVPAAGDAQGRRAGRCQGMRGWWQQLGQRLSVPASPARKQGAVIGLATGEPRTAREHVAKRLVTGAEHAAMQGDMQHTCTCMSQPAVLTRNMVCMVCMCMHPPVQRGQQIILLHGVRAPSELISDGCILLLAVGLHRVGHVCACACAWKAPTG